MTRRRGLSLTEVLVALFIMAIGLIAILTMFPLGALQMGQALKDDRTAQSAANADGYMRWYWKQYVLQNATDTDLVNALNNPDSQVTGGNPQVLPRNDIAVPVTDSAPSYPVVVDPMGIYRPWGTAGTNVQQRNWVGQGNLTRLARRNLAVVYAQPPALQASFALRTCSLLDGLGYDTNGAAVNSSNQVERDMRYNWLWVLQRPSNKDQRTVGMTVVLFEKRAHLYIPRTRNPETAYNPLIATIGETHLQFPGTIPAQKGGWIVDVTHTRVNNTGGAAAGTVPGVRNCNFYRVVSAVQNGNVTDVELQVPLKSDSVSGTPPTLFPQQRTFLVMDGVVEVFERAPISPLDTGQ
jgi:prepilin-type N-terminal cleavage/methylation domain-containing protein